MANVVITPRLIMGNDHTSLRDAIAVDTADDAARVISAGLTAHIPADSWLMAENTLRLLGATAEDIALALDFARSGGTFQDF